MRSKLKGVRRKAFVSGLPIVRVERCLQDALDNLETAVHKKTEFQARNSHRQHLARIGEKEDPEPEFLKEGPDGQLTFV